ncbi:hypothetical protein RJ640_028389 [Escallonia rubra]|uniref:FAS1 domain-containing protein n=1 Tax=Escallonia rubra TaxID=112253 RepID=A0AA88QZK7_9ASTE|nr:hypothetical protein RJ640_028389 [Escallonia rubra]
MATYMSLSLLLLTALISSSIATDISSRNQDLLVAIEEMQKANYFTFVMLINMIPPDLIQGNITFLMPNDRTLSKTTIPGNALADFVLLHSIPSPLLFDQLEHIPTGSMIPTSSNPAVMLKVSNNGRRHYFLNDVRIISPNICTLRSSIRCHGIDGVVHATAMASPPEHNNTTPPSPTCSNGASSRPPASPAPSLAPPVGGFILAPSPAPPPTDSSPRNSGSSSQQRHGGLIELAMTCMMMFVIVDNPYMASAETTKTPDLSITKPPSHGSPTHVFRSKLPDIPISSHFLLHTYCFEKMSEFADKACLIEGSTGKTYSYAETHLICRKTAAGLTSLGIKKGDVVMVLLQNCAEFVFAFMGASMIGAVITTVNPFYTSAEVFKQFNASKTKLVITQSNYVDKLRDPDDKYPKLGQDFKVITTDDPPPDCLHFSLLSECNDTEMVHNTLSIDPNDPVALPFSSGTTGLPKGVVLTHRSVNR